jgi:2-dehydropantoate 2-reductase
VNIGVIGPGAMGCLLAGRLALSGQEVILLDHQEQRADLVDQEGLTIEGIKGPFRIQVPVTVDAQRLSKADIILICVKAYDSRIVAQTMQKVNQEATCLTLQNGVGNMEQLGAYLPRRNILGGITSHGATFLGPGHVRHAGEGETFIGCGYPEESGLEEQSQKLEAARQMLNQAGFITQIVPRIKNLIWSKLLVNVGINALTALTRLRNGDLINYPGTLSILEEAVQEAIRVGKNKGIEFIFEEPLAQVKKVCQLTSANISSMLQDVLRKRRTEVDYINGVIMEEGARARIPTPVNTVLTRLVKTLEASYDQVAVWEAP